MNKLSSFVPHHSSFGRKLSFTLIGLLAVIAIIAILAALNRANKGNSFLQRRKT